MQLPAAYVHQAPGGGCLRRSRASPTAWYAALTAATATAVIASRNESLRAACSVMVVILATSFVAGQGRTVLPLPRLVIRGTPLVQRARGLTIRALRACSCHTGGVSVAILDREMYTEGAAARLLRVAPSTLHWWLEGRLPHYRPVIRPEPTGSRTVTWAEFVEAALLRSYRREQQVPLRELRDFIDGLRDKFQVPYPLADRRPYVGSGRKLLIDLQGRSHLDPDFCLVAVANGQEVLTAPGEEFFERVQWSGDEPVAWRPHDDPDSPVRINPLMRFGRRPSAGSPPRRSPGSLMGVHRSRRPPRTSAWTSKRSGGRTATSWRSRRRDWPGREGPVLR